jgi:hypothetical protein
MMSLRPTCPSWAKLLLASAVTGLVSTALAQEIPADRSRTARLVDADEPAVPATEPLPPAEVIPEPDSAESAVLTDMLRDVSEHSVRRAGIAEAQRHAPFDLTWGLR